MLSLRKKILLSDLALLLLFIVVLYPFMEKAVSHIMRRSLETRVEKTLSFLESTPDLNQMIDWLENNEEFAFYRVTLFNEDGKILYDSHLSRFQQVGLNPNIETPFASQASHKPTIFYKESYSNFFRQTFAYIGITFDAQGQRYLLRIGYPLTPFKKLAVDFQTGFLILGILVLLLYSIMTWVILHRLTEPIQQILNAILPYQKQKQDFLPKIPLSKELQGDEFYQLASTLNSLSERIEKQIYHLKRQKAETEGILEALGEGVIALDSSAQIIYANEVACKFLGESKERILHLTLQKIPSKNPELAQKCHELVLQVLQTFEPTLQTWNSPAPRYLCLELISTPLANQNGAILVLQDKTSDYKVLEMGKDFIANASHELRTPITIIHGFAETLHDVPSLSPTMLKEITGKILRTCIRLEKLVKSLLTLSDIENFSEIDLQPLDLVPFAKDCKELLVTTHPDIEIFLNSQQKQILVMADPDLLQLAVMNLLENAVKYSSAPAWIKIELRIEDNQALIVIQDRGIGIPESEIPHIFDRFYTVDKARSRKSGGAGLGLSIVKTILEKHQGFVGVYSQLQEGTQFLLSLPLKPE